MNAPLRPDATPRLEDFPYRLSDNVRFADLDPNQHVNNAVYATYFETGRVTLMKDRGYGLMPEGLGWIMVRIDIHFRAELHWPGQIELGLGVARLCFSWSVGNGPRACRRYSQRRRPSERLKDSTIG